MRCWSGSPGRRDRNSNNSPSLRPLAAHTVSNISTTPAPVSCSCRARPGSLLYLRAVSTRAAFQCNSCNKPFERRSSLNLSNHVSAYRRRTRRPLTSRHHHQQRPIRMRTAKAATLRHRACSVSNARSIRRLGKSSTARSLLLDSGTREINY